jgi:hypothetical protein
MIRWYDYIAAFIVADLTFALFFGVPIFGGIAAYLLVFYVWDYYCEYRKSMEQ